MRKRLRTASGQRKVGHTAPFGGFGASSDPPEKLSGTGEFWKTPPGANREDFRCLDLGRGDRSRADAKAGGLKGQGLTHQLAQGHPLGFGDAVEPREFGAADSQGEHRVPRGCHDCQRLDDWTLSVVAQCASPDPSDSPDSVP